MRPHLNGLTSSSATQMKTKPASMLWELIGRLANNCLTFRISGETGVGKEAIAHLIRRHYPHKNNTFINIDCKDLHGTFNANEPTGTNLTSITTYNSALDNPQNKVFYLENVQFLPEQLQTRLKKTLIQKYATASPWVFVSSIDPLENLEDNRIDPSLFDILNTFHIAVPPLRHFPENIPQILSWFLHAYSQKDPKAFPAMPNPNNLNRLLAYPWPGNLRQLQQVAWNAFTTTDWDDVVDNIDATATNECTQDTDEIAAIHMMSLAKISIHKEKIIEGFMSSSKLEEVGLLDLAIYHEAVSQISDHISTKENNPPQTEKPAPQSPNVKIQP